MSFFVRLDAINVWNRRPRVGFLQDLFCSVKNERLRAVGGRTPVCWFSPLTFPHADIQCFTVKPILDLPAKFQNKHVSEQIVR